MFWFRSVLELWNVFHFPAILAFMEPDCQADLHALLDREAIRDCLYRYCRGIDRADEAALRSTLLAGRASTATAPIAAARTASSRRRCRGCAPAAGACTRSATS